MIGLRGASKSAAELKYDLHIGIDYSGRGTPSSRTSALQVYAASESQEPSCVSPPSSSNRRHKNWCRREIAEWLVEQVHKNCVFIAGIDHGFSFPLDYFRRYGFSSWPEFLSDFCEHWPTDRENTCVDSIRSGLRGPPIRSGRSNEFRLTERWTSSAKSVFQFDVQGSVAKSTHAGLPWLRWIRNQVGDQVHVWPLDGWEASEGKSVLAEVYPSIFRNRYPRAKRTVDQQDAYGVARWLAESDARGSLSRYFDPPLTEAERQTANLEGWILGVL